MTRLVLAATGVLAGAFLWLQPAKAEAPWCAVITIGEDSVIWDCRFRTIEECRPTVLAGNRGFCNPNPYFTVASQPGERRRQRKQ
jgi:hypothetical protein